MLVTQGDLPGLLNIEPEVVCDARGSLFESFNARAFEAATGVSASFVQENHTRSSRNVLRGLHYQIAPSQGKLVRVIVGEVFDVAVDLRRSSSSFGRWSGVSLSAENKLQRWIPPGFAHGFLVVAEVAEVLYKTTQYWAPSNERCIRWNDPTLRIDWPAQGTPTVSARDATSGGFEDAEFLE